MIYANSGIMPSPTIQMSSLIASEVSDTQLVISATRGNGREYLIVAKLASSTQVTPVEHVTYVDDSVFGDGDDIGGGNYVVGKASDASPSLLITGLEPDTDYVFYGYEVNKTDAGTERYNVSTATGNPVSETTLVPQVAPSVQDDDLVFSGINQIDIDSPSSDALGRLIVFNATGTINAGFPPLDEEIYEVGDALGGGNIVGALGTDTRFYIDDIPYGATVAFKSYAYNIASGDYLFNVDDEVANPIEVPTPEEKTFVQYQETALKTRRSPYNLGALGSREFSQFYPTADYVGTTYHHVFAVAEGDNGTRLNGIDRTIRYRCDIADDPTIASNWVADSPVDAWGDTPSFLDSACLQYDAWVAGSYDTGDRVRTGTTNQQVWESTADGNTTNPTPGAGGSNWSEVVMWDGNQCWMMSVVEHDGYQYGIYSANRFIANRYGVGMIVSDDEFETYERFEDPIIPEGANTAAYYVHVHPTKIGGFWYLFMQNYVPALIVEGHLYCTQLWRTANDPQPDGTWTGWTKRSGNNDILSGRGYGGAVDISTSWDEGGKLHAYISVNDAGETGKYNTKAEGASAAFSTYPVGNRILEVSCEYADIEDFQTEHVVEREVFRSQQNSEIETRTWCPKRNFGGDDFFIGMSFKWRMQTLLAGISQNEPMNDGKIISRAVNLTGNVQIGNDIYPDWIRIFKPHQSHLDDTLGGTPVQPRNVIEEANGTIVGAPEIARLNCIQPVADGYVTDDNTNWIYDGNKVAVSVLIGENTTMGVYGIAAMEGGWEIWRSALNKVRVKVYGDDEVSYKEIEMVISSNKANNASDLLNRVGFIFDNGDLRGVVDFNLDAGSVIHDDTFTDMFVPDTDLKVGHTDANDHSLDVVGPLFMLSGAGVTDDHYLNNNFNGN